jgi:[ribosomal protein S5]-alanine N-acetyltransferase
MPAGWADHPPHSGRVEARGFAAAHGSSVEPQVGPSAERGTVSVVETERLVLRRLSVDDAEFIRGLLNDPSFLRYIGDKGVRTTADARAYIEKGPVDSYQRHGFGLYLAVRKEDGVPIGICGLVKREALEHVDVGFAFLPQFWSQGYALESASAVVAHGRNVLGLTRVVAVTTPDNHGSIKVLEKLGFRFTGRVRLSDDGPELHLFGSDGQSDSRRPHA